MFLKESKTGGLQYLLRGIQIFPSKFGELNIPQYGGFPKWMVYMENPIKMDDLGVPLFLETPTGVNTSSRIYFEFTSSLGYRNHLTGFETLKTHLWIRLGFPISNGHL